MLSFIFVLCLSVIFSAEPIDWKKCPQVLPGVRLCKLALTEPRLMKVNIIRVDLTLPGLRFAGTPRARNWGMEMPDFPGGVIRTFRETTADFMKMCRMPVQAGGYGVNMFLAVNSVPWTPWTTPFTHKYADPLGVMISNGVVVDEEQKNCGAHFVVWKDGTVAIEPSVPADKFQDIWLCAGGFAVLLDDGQPVNQGDKSIHPRMVYGISQDKHWLYLMTIDGRQKEWSIGANNEEMTKLMQDAGAWDAINMDGGGSTTMCLWDYQKNEAVMLNHHSGNSKRNVGGNIGLYIDPIAAKMTSTPGN